MHAAPPLRVASVALESSGRNWMDSALAQHPGLSVAGTSFPAHSDAEHRGYYPPAPDSFDVLVIGTRDLSCHRCSVERDRYEAETPGRFQDAESMAAVATLVAFARSAGKKVIFMSYEAALSYRQVYWSWLFDAIGVIPVGVVTEYVDGNRKYLRHEETGPSHE